MKKILLVLLFGFSLFAGESEEIGVPYNPLMYEKDIGSKIDDVTFSLDGNHIYTLEEDLITVYQTDPIKKFFSFRTGIEKVYNGYKILVTEDDKRIILYSRDCIQLWDIKTKKLLKTVALDIRRAKSSPYGLIILTRDNYLEILNDQSLEVIRKSKQAYEFELKTKYDLYISTAYEMFANDNTLLLRFDDGVMFFDLKTFEILDQVVYGSDMTLYLKRYQDTFGIKLNEFLTNDRKSPAKRFLFMWPTKKKQENLAELYGFFTGNCFHIIKYLHKNQSDVQRYTFMQLHDRWLFYEHKTHLFTGSENIKEYLQMETKDGKIVPMNQATFEKYNTQINLKD